MTNNIYFCKNCYEKHESIPHIFTTPSVYESIGKKCLGCGSSDLIKLNLNKDEYFALLEVNRDPDFILAMDKLKGENLIEFNIKLAQLKQSTPAPKQTDNIPKCPTCGSTDVKKISGTKRWLGVGVFGLASSDVGKNMQCNNCGCKW